MTLSPASRVFGWASLVGKFGFVQIIVQTLGFAAGLILVRLMSKDDYALYTLALSALGAMVVLTDSGIGSGFSAIAGRVWSDTLRLGQLVKTAMELRLILVAIIVVVLSPLLFFWLGEHGAKPFQAWLSGTLVACMVYFQATNGVLGFIPKLLLQTNRIQKVDFLSAMVRLLLVGAAGLIFLDFTTALLAGLVASVFQCWLLVRLTKGDFRKDVDSDPAMRSEILGIVRRQAPNSIYFCVQSQIIIWLLGVFGSSGAIADAGALGRLAVVFTIVGNIVASLAMPRFARCHSEKLLKLRYHQVVGLLALALCVLAFSVLCFPGQMLWILGNQYQGLEEELLLMAVAQSLGCLSGALVTLNLGRGWIVSPWIAIPAGLVTYTSLFLWIGASTLQQVLLVGILASLVGIAINYIQALYCMRRPAPAETEK
jgi:O-antigen/teichoic acid export membrane protein